MMFSITILKKLLCDAHPVLENWDLHWVGESYTLCCYHQSHVWFSEAPLKPAVIDTTSKHWHQPAKSIQFWKALSGRKLTESTTSLGTRSVLGSWLQNSNASFRNRFHNLTSFPTKAMGPATAKKNANQNQPTNNHLQKPQPSPSATTHHQRKSPSTEGPASIREGSSQPWRGGAEKPPGQHCPVEQCPRCSKRRWFLLKSCLRASRTIPRQCGPQITAASSQTKSLYEAQTVDRSEVTYVLPTAAQGTVT